MNRFLLFLSVMVLSVKAENMTTLYIALPISDEAITQLEQVANQISNPYSRQYGNYLSLEEIDRIIQTDPRYALQVDLWLHSLPVDRNITVSRYSDSVHITMPSELVKTEFNLNDKGYTIPYRLRGSISFIEGFYPGPRHARLSVQNVNKHVQGSDPGMVGREVLQRLYKLPSTFVSPSTSLGLMEYQGNSGFSSDNQAHVQNASNLPVDPITKDHIIGDNLYPDGESELDVQISSQVAPGATFWFEDFNGWMYGWASDFYNRPNVPYIVSLSWGWNEEDQCDIDHCQNVTSEEYVRRCNYEFMKLAVRGITIVIASGDAGSPGRTNEGCTGNPSNMNPVFPGSSQWATTVGATYLLSTNKTFNYTTPACHQVQCANGEVEEMVSFDNVGWTSGSGFDRWVETPNWQAPEVLYYLASNASKPNVSDWNQYGRGYPDVSAIGHNCLTYDDQSWMPADGTSCSAPLFAGILAILNDHQIHHGRPKIGFANPLLYQLHRNNPKTFTSILKGNSSCTEETCCGPDYGFAPIPGWNPVSGLGTPNVDVLLQELDNMFE